MRTRNVIDLDLYDVAVLRNDVCEALMRVLHKPLLNEQREIKIPPGLPRPGDKGIPKSYPEPEKFLELYLDPRLTQADIASRLGLSGDRRVREIRDTYRSAGYDIPDRNSVKSSNRETREREDQVYTGSNQAVVPTLRRQEVFPGVFYRDRTRLPKRRWEAWYKLWKRKQHVRPRSKGWRSPIISDRQYRKIFLFGYQIEGNAGIFFELWYDAYNGKFVIYDRYANPFRKNFSIMSDAVLGFVELIGKNDPGIELDNINSRHYFDIEKTAFSSKNMADREAMVRESLITDEEIEEILKESSATQSLFTNLIDGDLISSYHESRMSKALASRSFWQVWGRDVRFPPRYIGGIRGKALRVMGTLRGREIEGSFVKGYTFNNKIDIEIWYVKESSGVLSRSSSAYFVVYDITAAEIIGNRIPNLRQADNISFRKLAVKAKT